LIGNFALTSVERGQPIFTGEVHHMQTDLRGRDLITEQEWTRDEIDTLLDVAWDLKRKRALGEPHALLRDKVLAMLFFFTSTRTRASFEAGMAQLGGHAQFIDSETTQISHGDTAKGNRRNPGAVLRRTRHPAVRLEVRQPVYPGGGGGEPRASTEHAVRRISPVPDSG
jgi:hypothetical protein